MRGVQALTTLAQADAAEQAVPLVQHCAASFESEFTLAANAAATAAGAVGLPAPPPAPGAAEVEQDGEPLASAEELADRLAELLPSLLACARAPGAAESVCTAHALAYAHLPHDHTEFVTVALEYVSQLSLRAQPGDAERVESVLREMDDAHAAAPVEVQVRRAEAWLHAGDDKAFAESMAAIIESQTYMAAETDDILVRHVHAFHLQMHTTGGQHQKCMWQSGSLAPFAVSVSESGFTMQFVRARCAQSHSNKIQESSCCIHVVQKSDTGRARAAAAPPRRAHLPGHAAPPRRLRRSDRSAHHGRDSGQYHRRGARAGAHSRTQGQAEEGHSRAR